MVADGLLAALLTVIALPMLFLPSENFERLFATSFRGPVPLGVLLTLCQTVPLTWRRRAPYAVLAVTTAAATVHLAWGSSRPSPRRPWWSRSTRWPPTAPGVLR
jgi:hypothetical protein